MAEHVLSPTQPRSTRRAALGGGIVAFVAAASAVGITAGAAASVADLVPIDPDAELVRLCAQFDALERERQAVILNTQTREEEVKVDVILVDFEKRQKPLLVRICTTPCQTMAGAAAIASSLALWDDNHEISIVGDDPNEFTHRRLISALVRGLVGRASA